MPANANTIANTQCPIHTELLAIALVLAIQKNEWTRMHSSRMHKARRSSHPGGGGSPPGHCYCLLVWWPSAVVPSAVVALCYGLHLPPPQKAIPEGCQNQKAITEGHNRRPQQKAITEGHNLPPRDQAPPGSKPLRTRHPSPWRPAARHARIPPAMDAGIAPLP